MSFIKDGATVLFQGDSVTDVYRSREDTTDLGPGYAMMVAAWLAATQPSKRVQFINRGVGGNKTCDLATRWQEDCIDLKPDVVSILVGINDSWRRYDSNDFTSTEAFETNYRRLLDWTKKETSASLVLMEPFLSPVTEDRTAWREDLDPKIHVVRKLAVEYGAILIPLDGIFAAACSHREPAFWCPDGIHPSIPGHGLIARAWMEGTGEYAG